MMVVGISLVGSWCSLDAKMVDGGVMTDEFQEGNVSVTGTPL